MRKRILQRSLIVLLVAVVLLPSVCLGEGAGTDREVKLDIPDCRWDPNRADKSVGWCAEACIQMAMGYYGRYVPQRVINRAGNPDHPDLYVYDIDDSLNALGVLYTAWDASNRDISAFISWIKEQLLLGYPVLCGVKIYPTDHPHWTLDHFVLAVGFNADGLILNTQLDMDGQCLVSYEQLSSVHAGYSFKNSKNIYFARAITGLKPSR
jgi:hypothetical protein